MTDNISDKVLLKSGFSIPALGLGTYKSGRDELLSAVEYAYEIGYRHIDTATYYQNEDAVGNALKNAGINRESICLAAKLWPTDFGRAEETFYNTLRYLGTDYVDLYMMHWPGPDKDIMLKTYGLLNDLKEKGFIRSLGASNFLECHLDAVKEEFGEYPDFDQIELHPWQQHSTLKDFCAERSIAVTAWGPLMHGHLSEEKGIIPLAEKYGKTPAQIVLRWHTQSNNIVIPKSVNKERILENSLIYDFELSEADMKVIKMIDREKASEQTP